MSTEYEEGAVAYQSVVGYLEGDTEVSQWFPGGGHSPDPVASVLDLENVPEATRYSVQVSTASLGTEPGSTVRWWVMRKINNGDPSIFAICYTHDDAETIMHLLNGTK